MLQRLLQQDVLQAAFAAKSPAPLIEPGRRLGPGFLCPTNPNRPRRWLQRCVTCAAANSAAPADSLATGGDGGAKAPQKGGRRGTTDVPPTLIVVGGGAAGVFGAIRAKELCPSLEVVVLEKGHPLAKVRVSGGGRCNVTTGLYQDPQPLSGHYPRGHRELRGAFFRTHGPADTASWFEAHGVPLKTEADGRVFPVSDSSVSVINCLLGEARRLGVSVRSGAPVSAVRRRPEAGVFDVFITKGGAGEGSGPGRPSLVLPATHVLLATGSSPQGHSLARSLGHSIVAPRPSLFTFCVPDPALTSLAGVSFPAVRGMLQLLEADGGRGPQFSQVGPLLITHWGLSGPLVLRLSAWAARSLYDTRYNGTLVIDFAPEHHWEAVESLLVKYKAAYLRRKLGVGPPPALQLPRRFWLYLLQREGLDEDTLWAGTSTQALRRVARLIKAASFSVAGKGVFKDEFVTAGGVPLREVAMKSMESKTCPGLFFAGEVLDVDGETGGFNFQNAWTGGYIAGTHVAASAMADSPSARGQL